MDSLEIILQQTQFFKETHPTPYKYKYADGCEFLYFGLHNRPHNKSSNPVHRGSRKYPDIEKLLHEIAKQYFPEFEYNKIQINKNVRTPKHKDAKNTSDQILFTLGDFYGGRFCTELEDYNIYKNPLKFNGQDVLHWTESFVGDRYCIIYYSKKI
jgi:hypothetical protein